MPTTTLTWICVNRPPTLQTPLGSIRGKPWHFVFEWRIIIKGHFYTFIALYEFLVHHKPFQG